MAECRCGTCEHCTTPDRPPLARTAPRKLLTRSQVAILRRSDNPYIGLTLDAYETAVRLLEAVVRDPDTRTRGGALGPADIAWLALREAER